MLRPSPPAIIWALPPNRTASATKPPRSGASLIADAPAGANWVGTVRTALARVEGKPAAAAPLPGPTPAEMLAAAKQPPAQQDTMIKTMVARLAGQLKKDGSDVKGWEQLMRSYKVLGDTEKQKAAIADAKQALAGDADKLKQFETALKDIDNGTTGAAPARAEAPAAPPLPGPTPAQMLAASQQPPEQQDSMIGGMVGRLVERLKKDGSDLNGWVMLVRSYKVMGEPDKAKAAADEARRIFANDPEKMKQLEAGLKTTDASAGPSPAAPASPPPQQKGAQNAAPGTAGQHQGETIDAMVEGLAAKLKKSPDNPEGWLMLTRSYLTLKQDDKAKAAVKDARKALAADPEKLQMFEAALKQFKIEAPQ